MTEEIRGPEVNLLDRFIRYFSPAQAAKRIYARDIINQYVRAYEGAGRGRRWKNFKATALDAEREVSAATSLMRFRARALVRNNWAASRGVDAIVANTVGHGIEAAIEPKKLLTLWNDWARTREIDVFGTYDFFGLQQLALGTIAESGEVILKKVRRPSAKIPLQIQLLEGDYIDASRFGVNEKNHIRNGIEFDPDGRVVAYYLYDRHPGSGYWGTRTGLVSNRYTTDDVRLIFRQKRLGQVRGVSWLHNVMLKLRDLDDYDDAQLFRQKIAACFAGFIKTTEGPMNVGPEKSEPLPDKLEPGGLHALPPGRDISLASPPGVGADYDPYMKRQLMSVASGLGITYESLTGDYGNVNFSSARMGWLEMYRNLEMWRWGMLIPMLCDVVFDWFLEAVEIAGLADINRATEPVWTPPRREMIDPVKETQALKDQVRSGFTSYSEALRGLGKDPQSHMVEIANDFSKLDKLGLKIEADPRIALSKSGSQTSDKSNGIFRRFIEGNFKM